MSGTDDIRRKARRDAFEKDGTPASYVPAGGAPIPTVVVLERGFRAYPSDENPLVTGPLNIVHVLVEDVATQDRGDEIVIGSDTFTVDEVLGNDGYGADLKVR